MPEVNQSFMKIIQTGMTLADYACVAAIMWCGAQWMWGQRTKALEYLFGACVGYLIIRKAWVIMEFLRSI